MSGYVVSRRDVLRAAATGALISTMATCKDGNPPLPGADGFVPGNTLPWTNWADTESCTPARRVALDAESDVLDVLARSPSPVRPVGSSHSFSGLVPTSGTLVATDLLTGVISTDPVTHQAEVWAGTRLHELGRLLAEAGQALCNQPDIDYPSIGGATATATHGTGLGFGCLSSYVTGLTLATPSGELIECDRQRRPEVFQAARVSLGALGLITRLKLQNEPALRLAEVTRVEPVEDVLDDLTSRFNSNRHFELLALPHTRLCVSVTTNEAKRTDVAHGFDDPHAVYKLRQVYRLVRWLPGIGDSTYESLLRAFMGDSASTVRVGPSFEVLAHHRIVRFREMEYTVPAEAGAACLRDILRAIRETPIPVVFPIEFRRVAADDIWLSPFQGRAGCAISIHQYGDTDYTPYFRAIEPIFWRYEGRPHWGKLHTLDAQRLAPLYPAWRDFQDVRSMLDPSGRMLNPHLRKILGA